MLENRAAGSGKTIELAFVRFKCTGANPGSPIVYLAGGPGGSGINAARYDRFPLFMAMREVADVIAFDQRATGMSSAFEEEECEGTRPRPPGHAADHLTVTQLSLEVAKECAEFWRKQGVDLAAYNTNESADDLEDLRRALGVEKLSLWAISYGTHLALATLRRYPDRIDRVILAGVEGPDHTVKLPSYSEQQLDNLIELIDATSSMKKRYPDLRNMIRQTLDTLERHPVTLEFVPPDGGAVDRVVVGRPEAARATIGLLRDPSTMVAIPSFYQRMVDGDFFDLAEPSTLEFEFEAMSEAMDAASGMSVERRQQFEREAKETLLGGGDQLANADMVEALGVPDLGDAFRAPVQSDVPALFISGTLDGRTPVRNAEEVLAGFPNGAHLILQNAGHSNALFLSSARILETMLAFMKGETVESQRLTVEPPSFSSVRERTILSPEIAKTYLGEYLRGEDDEWTVISLGSYRSLSEDGEPLMEDARIQLRHGRNGYSLTPVSDTTFYVAIPGWEQMDFTFVVEDDVVHRIEFTSSSGELVPLIKRR